MNILRLLKRLRPAKQPEISADLKRREIILSGSGGQGIILAGKILAEAASIYDNKNAIMTQSYGPEARGGASKAEVIISSDIIDYPKVMHADILLTMTQEALDRYGNMLKEDGLLIADEIFVKKIPDNFKNVFKAPLSSLAIKELDAPIVVNIISLGCLAFITKIVSREALIHAMLDHVSARFLVTDRIAVDMGFKVARESGFVWLRKD